MGESYTTVKATLRRRVALAESHRAFERWAATRPRGSVAMARLESEHASTAAEQPDVVLQTSRLWLEPPSRWRYEVDVPGGVAVIVSDGPLWWSYAPSIHALSNESAPQAHPPAGEHPEWQLLHAREVMRALAVTATKTGEHLGRSVDLVDAVPVGDADPRLAVGADAYEFAIDHERGVGLRITSRCGGRDLSTVEVVDLEFDAPFDPGVFRLELPAGIRFVAHLRQSHDRLPSSTAFAASHDG